MPDSSIDRSVTLPDLPKLSGLDEDALTIRDYLRDLNVCIAAFYDNLAERINQFLILQDWQDQLHAELTASQDNYNLADGVVHRFSTSGPQSITGFLAPQVARFVIVLNMGPDALTIPHQSASSDADNRVITTTALSLALDAGKTAGFWYDTDSAVKKWRQLF